MLIHDPDVQKWVYGILHGEPEPSGDFLKHFAQVVVRADAENYSILRKAILAIMYRFPKYKCCCQEWGIKSIVCPKCGLTSFNPKDVRERYCGHCHNFHEAMRLEE